MREGLHQKKGALVKEGREAGCRLSRPGLERTRIHGSLHGSAGAHPRVTEAAALTLQEAEVEAWGQTSARPQVQENQGALDARSHLPGGEKGQEAFRNAFDEVEFEAEDRSRAGPEDRNEIGKVVPRLVPSAPERSAEHEAHCQERAERVSKRSFHRSRFGPARLLLRTSKRTRKAP